jgi:hypothetical protein
MNLHRKKILDKFDLCVDKGKISFDIVTQVQCEIINMLEEINFWNQYAFVLKKELDDFKNNNSNSNIIL